MKLIWSKLRRLFQRSRLEEELREELAFHLEEESEEQQAVGRSTNDAREAARRSLGNVTRLKEETRAAWEWAFLETALQDARIAIRSLRKNPRFSVVAILVLGLGVGASTAVFSVVNGVILKPLAFRNPDRIVALRSLWKKTGVHGQVSFPDFADWRSQSSAFEFMAAYYAGRETAVSIESGPQFAGVAVISPEFFRVFDVDPVAGHLFQPEEMAGGSNGAAIVSNSFWQAHYGGQPSALGKAIRLGGRTIPIVGIMPAGFRFPDKTEIWIPMDTVFRTGMVNRGGHNYLAVGRLKPGVTLENAQAEMNLIGNRLEQLYAGTNQDKNVAVAPLGAEMVRDLSTMLYLLLGSVSVLLLISCGNVANLLLAKAAERTREMGVRAALGAARGRIVRQLVTESLVLGTASLLLGLVVARFGTAALIALAPGTIPRLEEISIDPVVLDFAGALTLVACLLFGLAPAFGATRLDVNQVLKQTGSRGSLRAGSTLRSGLVVAEVALSVVLLTGAGLLIRSLAGLSNVSLGFETHQVLVMETSNLASDLEGSKRVVRSYQTLLDQAARIPGIAAIAAIRTTPGQVGSDGAYEVDQAASAGTLTVKSPQAVYSIVSPGAFAVLGIAVRQGRDFSAVDGPDAPLTAIVNETLARRAFPGQDPIGHLILTGMDFVKPMTIVGVVGDIHQKGPARIPMAEVFMPYEQHPAPSTNMRIVAKTTVPPASVMDALRQKAKQIAPEMPVKFSTMEARMWDNIAIPRFRTLLLAIFAAIAVVLAMAGVYGVVSLLVNQRSQEIGLRMALGASNAQVMNLVLSQGVRLAAIGLVLGVAGAAASTQLLASMLFEVKALDPLTYVAVAAVVALVTLGACFLPARRASRIDPMLALREE